MDIGGIHDVDDRLRLLVEDKIPADQLLAGIRRHGIDAGKVRNGSIPVTADHAVLAVHRDPGEVAHMLVGTGQLIKEGRLAAVLVAHQRKAQQGSFRQGIAATLRVIFSFLTQTGVFGMAFLRPGTAFGRGRRIQQGNLNVFRVRPPQRELISVQTQLHGVTHRSQLDEADLGTRNHTHIQKMPAKRAFSANSIDPGSLPDLQII